MADQGKPTLGASVQQILVRQSPMGLLANFRARRMGVPVPFGPGAPLRADVGWPWRMDWGGHDPASPIAEMHINYHNTGWAIMIFVCTTVFYIMTKR
mmetsp:Transcript_10646/g.28189  ORF Transcript_10646/g.28189 Transcript_10646/m.28189 type:complete len:97 (+) Transcript_10646:79-369(+)